MTIRNIGRGLTVLGLLGVALSLLVDLLPGAKAGIQSTQIVGIEISIVILIIGAWMLLSESKDKVEIKKLVNNLMEQVINLPVIAWVLIGFMVCYILFFVSPIFLNDTHRMKYFLNYLPDRFPIGNDLIAVLDLAKGWFFEGKSPFSIQFYPPFTYIFFAPLLLAGNYPALFTSFTLFSIASYFILTLILPIKITGTKNLSMILLFFLTGLVSYGFQFELERGQYNVFTFLLCLLAIYIFHNHKKHRLIAYLLFSLSVQLKIYPAIFIVMFVDDWRDWKIILRRFAGIGVFNFLLLFIMGAKMFLEFINSVATQITTPGWGWNGNHSIKAFAALLANDGLGMIPPNVLAGFQGNPGPVSTLLLLLFLAVFVSAIVIFHLRREPGIDMYLLITCLIGALIIPVSNDYTLSILIAPMALFLGNLPEMKNTRYKFTSILLILGMAVSYSSLLIPFKYKPYFLSNAFPPLFLILIFATILNFLRYRNDKSQPVNI